MNNQLPLIFSAYYLDFSYPGQFNAETRTFINLPCADQALTKNKEIDFLSICFEMTSVFDREGYFDKTHNTDNGLKVMLKVNKVNLSMLTEQNLINKLELNDSNINQMYVCDEEFGLYKNMVSRFENFLVNSYSDNWINFYSEKRQNFNKKYNVDGEFENTNDERNKLDKFIMQSVNRLQKMLTEDLFDEKIIKNLNLTSIDDSFSNSFNKMAGNINPLEELMKIAKKNSYFELKDELSFKSESKPKNFKL